MELKINLSLTKKEAKSLWRHLVGDIHYTDWDTINEITDELTEILNQKDT